MFMVLIFILSIAVVLVIAAMFVMPSSPLRNWLVTFLAANKNEEEALIKLLQSSPRNIRALERLGDLYFSQADYKNAYEYYARLLFEFAHINASQVSTDRFQAYVHFGIAAYKLDKKDEALTSLQKAKLVINATNTSELFYYIGLIFYERSEYSDAARALQQAYEQSPTDLEIIHHLAICFYQMENFEAATPLLEKLLNPENPGEIEFYLGASLAHLQKFARATPCLEQAAKKSDYKISAWHELLRIHLDQEDYEQALSMCRNIIGENDISAAEQRILCYAYYHGAQLMARIDRLKDAAEMLDKLMELDQNYEDAKRLHQRYHNTLDSPQLFRLLEGEDDIRSGIVRKLAVLLVPNLDPNEIKIVQLLRTSIGATASTRLKSNNQRDRYYIWLNLYEQQTPMNQLIHAHAKSKEYACNHCIMACPGGFESDGQPYIEGRAIRLLGEQELKGYLNKTMEKS